MTTAVRSRSGRGYWTIVLLSAAIVLVITGFSVGWVARFLNEPADPTLSAGDQAGLDLAARFALVDWAIRLGILVILAMIAFLARKWMVTIERQASVAEAQLAAAREQIELTQVQLSLHKEATRQQSELAEFTASSDRFSRAIVQATSGSAALRTVGLLALEDLARDHEEQYAASVYEFLVALVKERSTPTDEDRALFESVAGPGERTLDQIPTFDPDGDTAITILGRNRDLFDRNVDYLAADSETNPGNGLHLVNVDLSGAWFRGLNLRGATLTGVRMRGAVLVDVDLAEANLFDLRAGEAIFDKVDLSRAKFHSSTFAEATLTDTVFERATISATDFGAAAITKSSFRRANATGTGFVGAVVTDCTFEEALLTGTSFRGALFTDLGGPTRFTKATLSSVAFNDTTFAATAFDQAAVNDADYSGARLAGVSFAGANLRQVNLRDATLSDLNLEGTELFSVNFDEATHVDGLATTPDPDQSLAEPSDPT